MPTSEEPDGLEELLKILRPGPEVIERILTEGPRNYLEELQLVLAFSSAGLITRQETDEGMSELARRFAKAYYEEHGPPGPILRRAVP